VRACGAHAGVGVRGEKESFPLKSKQNEKKEFSFEVLLYNNNNNKMHYPHVYIIYIYICGAAFLNCLFHGNELCTRQVFNVV
jgi:hypothetical protein